MNVIVLCFFGFDISLDDMKQKAKENRLKKKKANMHKLNLVSYGESTPLFLQCHEGSFRDLISH